MILSLADLTKVTQARNLMHGIHYSYRFQSLYFSVPKCGCSSIKTLIQTYEQAEGECDAPLEIPDVHDKKINQYALPGLAYLGLSGLSPDDLIAKLTNNSTFRYTFVRNPYDRLVSAYKDKILKSKDQKLIVVNALFPHLKKLEKQEKLATDVSFVEFVNFVTSHEKHIDMDLHWRPQVSISLYDYIKYDIIGKLEDAEMYWKQVYEAVYSDKVKFMPLERRNSSGQNHIKSNNLYTRDLAEKVFKFYQRDFEIFEYEKNSYLD